MYKRIKISSATRIPPRGRATHEARSRARTCDHAAPARPSRCSALDASAGDGDWSRLERFLYLGTDAGAYHAAPRELALEDARVVTRCLGADGLRTIDRIVAASSSGRAPKNDPAIFSLAVAAKLGDEPARRAAYAALPRVCHIGSQLMQFAGYAQQFGGWGRGMRNAIGAWFNARPASDLALQLAMYRARDGWTNRDLLRLAHPRAASPSHDRLFAWAVRGELPAGAVEDPACDLIVGLDELDRTEDANAAAAIVRSRRIPAECVPAPHLSRAAVWDALLDTLPMAALIRSLPSMTRAGLLAAGTPPTRHVVARLRDRAQLASSALHPLAWLAALVTYRSGRGPRGQGAWLPVASIVDALEDAFYESLAFAPRSDGRTLIALDVSGSMASGSVGGVPNLSPRLASAAMALVSAATERATTVVAFTSAANGFGGQWGGGDSAISPIDVSRGARLDDLVGEIGKLPMGGTDCALPMQWAQEHRVDVDTFVIYTDNETWTGHVHPVQALRAYRDARAIPAKLVVVGMTSTGFSIADPDDTGMLDVVGFDPSTPPVIADFARS
ncbi:MAG: TROVE domain-containing protein [Deltaproteobacteria bacterium]|nr:TROVE domain-containing protein [Deltaproteobacteria bacterium]